MKVFILDIRDGNGCRLIIKLSKDDALQAAQDWLKTRPGGLDPHYESWFNDCMDTVQSGTELRLANLDYIVMVESEIDLGFVTEALEDAQFTLSKAFEFSSKYSHQAGAERIKSRCLATEQVLHLTLQKLKGQP